MSSLPTISIVLVTAGGAGLLAVDGGADFLACAV